MPTHYKEKLLELEIYLKQAKNKLENKLRNELSSISVENYDKREEILRKILELEVKNFEKYNDELKNICSIEHSRHRSTTNFMTNFISALIAYCFFPKKPSIKYETEESGQLVCF